MHAALSDIVIWEECSAPGTLLCVGMKVRAKYVDDEYSDDGDDTDDEFDNAMIRKVNDDQTFDVVLMTMILMTMMMIQEKMCHTPTRYPHTNV